MNRPISKADICEVINGVYRDKSPNIGKRVTVQSIQGNHSQLGVIWRCTGPNLTSYNDMVPADGAVDFPALWLRRIDSDPPPQKVVARELENT